MNAIDENGRTVILNEDGSWQFDSSKEWRVVRTYMGDSTDKNTDLFEFIEPQWGVRVSQKIVFQFTGTNLHRVIKMI
jgi:VCBS repeat-containing protein